MAFSVFWISTRESQQTEEVNVYSSKMLNFGINAKITQQKRARKISIHTGSRDQPTLVLR
jgi:hypothetical protein